ncbi:MAG: SgcJ/EcaC family oxidoreductase [Chloroflexi bacterium]|nr:SgcJ/EcaC family oxidoreductase [Chloroflexota bacterium]
MPGHFDDIRSALDRVSAAWKANDGSAVASFFVEDGSLINPFGQRADGRTAVAAMYSEYFGGMLRGTSTTFNLASVRAVGDNYAFADGEQAILAPDGNVVLNVHIAALLRRDADGWRFVDSRPYVFATMPS